MLEGRGADSGDWAEDIVRSGHVRGCARREHGGQEADVQRTIVLRVGGWASWLWASCLFPRTESLYWCSIMG